MNEIKDIIIPAFGKLNSDNDLVALPKHDSPVDVTVTNSGRLNVVPKEGRLGTMTNIKGNELETYSLPSGTNKVVGGGEDIEDNAYIILIYNSGGNHTILQYNYDATFTLISQNSIWGFTSDMEGIEVHVIGTGDDKMVEFTDGTNEPRLFNKKNVRTGVYSSLGIGNIDTLRPYPLYKMSAVKISRPTLFINNVKGRSLQFTYRFHYDTGMVSAWSFYSWLNFGTGAEIQYIDDSDKGGLLFETDLTYNNGILLTYYVDYNSVKSVDIAVREMDIGLGVFGDWLLYDNIKHTTIGEKYYYFFNDKNKSSLDQSEFSRIFDDVPVKAKVSEILNNNRICYGQITKGYNPIISSNITLEHVFVNTFSIWDELGWFNASNSELQNGETKEISLAYNDEYYSLYFTITGQGQVNRFFVTSTKIFSSQSDLTDHVVTLINSTKTFTNVVASKPISNLVITNSEAFPIYVCFSACGITVKYKSYPSGSNNYFGINYYDNKGRLFSTYIDNTTSCYIKQIHETIDYNAYDKRYNAIKYTISHIAPTRAAYWSWAYGGCSFKNMYPLLLCMEVNSVTGYLNDFYTDSQHTSINIVNVINRYAINYNIPEIRKGFKIKFVSWYTTQVIQTAFTSGIDFEILSYSEGIITISSIESILPRNTYSGRYIIAYIYEINNSIDASSMQYLEVGRLLPITNGYHSASTVKGYGVTAQNQTVSLPAIGIIDFGNCYRQPITFSEITTSENYISFKSFSFESFSFSQLYNSKQADTGRINIYDPEYKQKETNAICYGGAYSEEGIFFNELNKFDLIGNTVDLDNKYGNVYGLKQEGYTLNVFQQSKVTTIGVGVDILSNADGSANLQAIQNVLGNPRPFIENTGSIFQSAIIKNNRHIYFPDIYSGEVYRKSANGLFPISDYGMSNYFRVKFKTLLDSGISNIHMYGGWDAINSLYILTMVDSSDSANNETIGFHEPTNTWFSFYSFIPEGYGKIGETLFLSFKSGATWKHYSDTVLYCNFYNAQYDIKVSVVSNELPYEVKRFYSIEENSNAIFSAPDNDSIIVYSDSKEYEDSDTHINYKGNMVSRLKEDKFKYREGIFRANFLRDAKTTSSVFKVTDLQTGRPLRGLNILLKLKNTNTDEVILRSVVINSARSK